MLLGLQMLRCTIAVAISSWNLPLLYFLRSRLQGEPGAPGFDGQAGRRVRNRKWTKILWQNELVLDELWFEIMWSSESHMVLFALLQSQFCRLKHPLFTLKNFTVNVNYAHLFILELVLDWFVIMVIVLKSSGISWHPWHIRSFWKPRREGRSWTTRPSGCNWTSCKYQSALGVVRALVRIINYVELAALYLWQSYSCIDLHTESASLWQHSMAGCQAACNFCLEERWMMSHKSHCLICSIWSKLESIRHLQNMPWQTSTVLKRLWFQVQTVSVWVTDSSRISFISFAFTVINRTGIVSMIGEERPF